MHTVTVEWMHLDKNGETCERCSDTGTDVKEIVKKLNRECASKQIQIVLKETKLAEGEIDKSNLILIDGIPMEDILPGAVASESACCSCGELTGKSEVCRTIVQFSEVHESIPQKMIHDAVCQVADCC